MSDSYQENVRLLLKCLKPEIFRFILIQYNRFRIIGDIKKAVQSDYPNRKTITLLAEKNNYRQLLDKIYELNAGIVFIDDFENILKQRELYAGLNQRRDKISQYPIAVICFLPAGSKYLQKCVEKIPDLWSFRSLYLNLRAGIIDNTIKGGENLLFQGISENSSLGGKSYTSKEKEYKRLKTKINELSGNKDSLSLLITLYNQILPLAYDLAYYQEGIQFAGAFFKIIEKSKSQNKNNILEIYSFLGFYNNSLGNYKIALEYDLKSVEISVNSPEQLPLKTAVAYSNLAATYFYLGNLNKSLEFGLKALEIRENILDKNHPEIAQSLSNISVVYRNMNDLEKSLKYALQALRIAEKKFIKNHPDQAKAYNNVSVIYGYLGNFEKSLDYANKSMPIFEKTLGKKHPLLAMAYYNISYTWFYLDEPDKAKEYVAKALIIYQKTLPTGHPDYKKALEWQKKLILQG